MYKILKQVFQKFKTFLYTWNVYSRIRCLLIFLTLDAKIPVALLISLVNCAVKKDCEIESRRKRFFNLFEKLDCARAGEAFPRANSRSHEEEEEEEENHEWRILETREEGRLVSRDRSKFSSIPDTGCCYIEIQRGNSTRGRRSG